MNALPEDVMWFIYKKYWSIHVIDELLRGQTFTWKNPSENLKKLCSCDRGSIQFGYNDLWEILEDEELLLLGECLHGTCANCQEYGWPCANLATYGFENEGLTGLWGKYI